LRNIGLKNPGGFQTTIFIYTSLAREIQKPHADYQYRLYHDQRRLRQKEGGQYSASKGKQRHSDYLAYTSRFVHMSLRFFFYNTSIFNCIFVRDGFLK
jgi:hypothetical protein